MCLHRVRRIAQLIGSTSGEQAQMPLYGRRHFVLAHNISDFNRQFIANIVILNVGGGWRWGGDRKQMCNCIFFGVTAKKQLLTAFLKM